MSCWLRLLSMGGVVLLAGCDLAPHYTPPATTLPPLPASYKEGGRWQPATPADALPRGPWWHMYKDPLLDQLETQLIAANPDLEAAIANFNAYSDQASEEDAYLFPFATATGSATRNRESLQRPLRTVTQPTLYDAQTLGGEVHYELDLWDQIHNQVAAGVANAQAVGADLASARLSLEADLASSYLTLRELDDDVQLLTETVAAYQHYLRIVDERHGDNISSGLEVSQARYQIDAAQAQESGIQAQRAVYEHVIAALVGKPASSFSIAPKVTDIQLPVIPTGMPSGLLQRRPDIAAAERRVAAANANIGVARAAFYPTLTIDGQGGFQSSASLSPLSMPFSFWSIGPSVTLPIFEGGLLRAELAQKVAQWHLAVANYRSTALQAFQEVESGLSNVNLLSEQDVQQQTAVKDAQHTEQLSLDLYRIGANNYLDAIVNQELALGAEQAGIDVRERLLQASVSLIRALGGGWSSDELPNRKDVLTLTATVPTGPDAGKPDNKGG
jgi:NodT family efflux transporter outer membrane factor (OMF) lipoprotein